MTQGASCDYMTVAEAEEIEEQRKRRSYRGCSTSWYGSFILY